MYITNELYKIGIFLTDYRFITVLEKLACSVITAIERDSISRKELPHQKGYARRATSQKKVGMVWHECPGIAYCLCFR
jgi:hypothetical protein